MSDRMTSVRLKTGGPADLSIAEWGRRSRPEMLAALRAHAQRQKESAERILAADDEDLVVETYTGHIVQRNLKEVTA